MKQSTLPLLKNILVIGNGGREHALAWKAKLSKLLKKIYVAPGNGGTENEKGIININIPADNIDKLANFAIDTEID